MGQILAMFRVDGRPRTKGSLKAVCTRSRSHAIRYQEEVKDSSRWRRMVALAAQRHQREVHGGLLGLKDPVEVRLVAYFERQLSRAAGCPDGVVIPSHRTDFPIDIHLGDADKLARNVGDALTDSGLIRDDSQIADFLISKRWATPEHPAGVEILVMTAELELDLGGGPAWMPGGVQRA